MEGEETQADTEAHVNCAKEVMMMLEMLALPEKGHVANQEESGRSLNGRSLIGTLPGGSGPIQNAEGTPGPIYTPAACFMPSLSKVGSE